MTSRPCQYGPCSNELPLLANADARYCSGRCRVAAFRERRRQIPAAMRSARRWVRYSDRKVPLQADGRAASSTDPATWTTIGRVSSASTGAGIGFVLNGDGIVCVDLDHCVEDGVVADWAQALVDRCQGTFMEISPSGTGLHIWGRGHVDKGRRRRIDGHAVEVYGTGRYLTVSRVPAPGSAPRLLDLSAVLADLV